MMAPAMSAGESEQLPYLDLAQSRARISRRLPARDLARLGTLTRFSEDAHAELEFWLDEDRCVRVGGKVRVRVEVDCQRCLNAIPLMVEATLDSVIARQSDAEPGLDAIMAQGATIGVADLVEDELILAIPQRACTAEPCPKMPEMSYGEPAAAATEEHPFAVLEAVEEKTVEGGSLRAPHRRDDTSNLAQTS